MSCVPVFSLFALARLLRGHGQPFHLVVQAAINGDGVALGRGALVAEALRDGTLVKPFDLSLPSRFSYFAVSSRASLADPVVAAFRQWLIEEGAASQAELERQLGAR